MPEDTTAAGLGGAAKGAVARLANMGGEALFRNVGFVRDFLSVAQSLLPSPELLALLVSATGGAMGIPKWLKTKLRAKGVPAVALAFAEEIIDDLAEGIATAYARAQKEGVPLERVELSDVFRSVETKWEKKVQERGGSRSFAQILGEYRAVNRGGFLRLLEGMERLYDIQAPDAEQSPWKVFMKFRWRIAETWVFDELVKEEEVSKWPKILERIYAEPQSFLRKAGDGLLGGFLDFLKQPKAAFANLAEKLEGHAEEIENDPKAAARKDRIEDLGKKW